MRITANCYGYHLRPGGTRDVYGCIAEVLSGVGKDRIHGREVQGYSPDKIVSDYTRNILNGGTDCIERVLTLQPSGMYKATTRQTFVPWLADMSVRDTSNIITMIGDAEKAGVHPRQIAKELEAYFKGTKHNAMTAARTEASKIRNDARSASFEESGETVDFELVGTRGAVWQVIRNGKNAYNIRNENGSSVALKGNYTLTCKRWKSDIRLIFLNDAIYH